jgi:hypothetical protein
MTFAVLGLDAADYQLAQHWECSNLLQDNWGELETYAHTRDMPITAEVWPTIATGRMPDDGGFTGRRDQQWSGLMKPISAAANYLLPKSIRVSLGHRYRSSLDVPQQFDPSDADHLFSAGAVYNWPGATPAKNWARSTEYFRQLYRGELADEPFFRRQLALTGEEIGWLHAMSQSSLPVLGTRCHILDHTGHAWADHPEKLRRAYEAVDSMVGMLRDTEHIDSLLVVSDHGMTSPVVGDDTAGSHSWRAMVSYSEDVALPEHVADVREWVEQSGELNRVDERAESTRDTPEQLLRDLGYL